MLLFIIRVALFKSFSIPSSKEEHCHRYYREEDKDIGLLWINAPKCCDLINRNHRYGQIKVFSIS